MERLLTCREIAERYEVNIQSVWRWIRSGKLRAVKISSRYYRVRPDDLAAFEQNL